MGSAASRAGTLALLVIADAAFLWMFLSTDPLEQLAADLRGTRESLAVAAFRFAADWRHGMAGNSWVYMPGFFATAAAVWLHARHTPSRLAHAERIVAGLVALLFASAGAGAGSASVVRAFTEANGTQFAHAIPATSAASAFSGTYTLVTWSVFVLACRAALVRRTFRPFVLPAILAIGLAGIRPWTVDDFMSHWTAGVATGVAAAQLSFALAFVVAALLAASERRSPKPQPGQTSVPDDGSTRPDHEEQVSGCGDEIKAGRSETIDAAKAKDHQDAKVCCD
jgi:hypothetical protein